MTVARDIGARTVLHDVRLVEGVLSQSRLAHVLVLCAFGEAFPMRGRIERLFVRRRTLIEAGDLELPSDRAMLIEAARNADEPQAQRDGFIRIWGAVDADRVNALLTEVPLAPLGSVLPWLLCAEMLGTSVSYAGSTSDAIAPYRGTLLRRLAALADRPREVFLEWLAGRCEEEELETLLRAALDALRAAATLASLVRS